MRCHEVSNQHCVVFNTRHVVVSLQSSSSTVFALFNKYSPYPTPNNACYINTEYRSATPRLYSVVHFVVLSWIRNWFLNVGLALQPTWLVFLQRTSCSTLYLHAFPPMAGCNFQHPVLESFQPSQFTHIIPTRLASLQHLSYGRLSRKVVCGSLRKHLGSTIDSRDIDIEISTATSNPHDMKSHIKSYLSGQIYW